MGGDGSFGERGILVRRGEPLLELGGVNREPPRRTWQVGHILTKREMSSFGTLYTISTMTRGYIGVVSHNPGLGGDAESFTPLTTNRPV